MNFSFFKIMSELAHMTNMQFLGVGVALASVVIGYSHMTKRDQRALEEMHQTFMKKSEWEETKDKLFERFLSQDEKIRDMEEERKTLELQILTMGKRLKELETEEKGSHQRREERDRQMRSSSDVRELAPNAVNRNLSLPSIFMSEDFSSPWTV